MVCDQLFALPNLFTLDDVVLVMYVALVNCILAVLSLFCYLSVLSALCLVSNKSAQSNLGRGPRRL